MRAMRTQTHSHVAGVDQSARARPWRRVAVIGSGGAGKSTLARRLAEELELPVVHLDSLFWGPDWAEMPQEEWRSRQEAIARSTSWIIDGTHAPTLDVRLRAADAVVMLDLNRVLCTWRIVKRRFVYRHKGRADRAPNCREHLDWKFVRWVWTYPTRGRPVALAAIARYAPKADVVRVTSRRAVAQLLKEASQRAASREEELALAV